MAGSEFTKMAAERTQREMDAFYDINANRFFNVLRMGRKGPQMSTDLTERYDNARKIGGDTASSFAGAVGNTVTGAMGPDEAGRLYSSGLSPITSLAAFGARMGVLGLTYLHFKGHGGAIDAARKYGELMNARGGNGFTAVPLTKGSKVHLGAYDGNKGATNLANMEKMYGDRLGNDIVNGSTEDLMKFEAELVKSNVVFCDRTVGTLNLDFGNAVPDSINEDIYNELKKRGYASLLSNGKKDIQGKLTIPNIEQADAESIVHSLYRCKAKEESALMSSLIKDEKFKGLSPKAIADKLASNDPSILSSFKNEKGEWKSESLKEAFERYQTYGKLPLTEIALEYDIDGETTKTWMCLNRLKKNGDGSGFVNEVNGIEMPVEFSYMGKDRNKFIYTMEKCGLGASQRLTGEMDLVQFINISADPQKGFKMQQYDLAPGMTFEEFRDVVSKQLPNIPWCRLPQDDSDGPVVNSVYVPVKSFDAVKLVADRASEQQMVTQVQNRFV